MESCSKGQREEKVTKRTSLSRRGGENRSDERLRYQGKDYLVRNNEKDMKLQMTSPDINENYPDNNAGSITFLKSLEVFYINLKEVLLSQKCLDIAAESSLHKSVLT